METNRQELIRRYARLIVRTGLNVQPEQEVLVNALVDAAPFIRLIVKEAYDAGAKKVDVVWKDEEIARTEYAALPLSAYEAVPDWQAVLRNGIVQRGGCVLTIDSADPAAFAGVDPKKPAAWVKAMHRDCKPYYDGLYKGRNTWCIAAIPSPNWARKVFPELPEEQAIDRLWDAILTAVRADEPDPDAAWEEHRKSFAEKKAFLNDSRFDALRLESPSTGTSITVGLPEGHIWAGGGDRVQNGTWFFPNMPTEEIFCSPHRDRVDGVVHNALPLCYQGNLIDHFSLTYKGGRVVDFSAEVGYETLKALLETDEGALRLGECALIPKGSPIARTGILFYNTLFDENAACHFAMGSGFEECVEGGLAMTEEELLAHGINQSAAHVDFMFGTDDLSITGIGKDGSETPVFRDGKWAF
ncbi:MAG: aminopeptidase [Oscillospiraceae bacterium]|nr:aminopeptidase [Oscillospiraceae bacterium]